MCVKKLVLVYIIVASIVTSFTVVMLASDVIDLDYVDTDIRAIAQDISFNTGVQIIVDYTARDFITVGPLENVPLERGLDIITASGNLAYVRVEDYYIILEKNANNPTFQRYSERHWVKLDYIDAKDIPQLLKSYEQYLQVDDLGNRVIINALPGKMMENIQEEIKKLDVPILNKVEIRLVSLEYSKTSRSGINLDALNLSSGINLSHDGVHGISIDGHLFGAASEDELKSLMQLKILSTKGEVCITGEQSAIVLEGRSAAISRGREGTIFVNQTQGSSYTLRREDIRAMQGVEVEIIRVTSDNKIFLNITGQLENLLALPGSLQEEAWIDKRNIQTSILIDNYQTIPIGTLSRRITEEHKGLLSWQEEDSEIETLFLLTARVIDTEAPTLVTVEDEVHEFFENSQGDEERQSFGIYGGTWISHSSNAYVLEGDFYQTGPLKLFVGVARNDDVFMPYGGIKYTLGNIVDIGLGFNDSDVMYTGGLSFGGDKIKLNIDYLYVPTGDGDRNGIKATAGIRF